jgi:hypothetical protein
VKNARVPLRHARVECSHWRHLSRVPRRHFLIIIYRDGLGVVNYSVGVVNFTVE